MQYPSHPTADLTTDPAKPRLRNLDAENGIAGTVLQAEVVNDILFNLMRVVEGTGGVPTANYYDDLLDAIGRMIGGGSAAHTLLTRDVTGSEVNINLTAAETSRVVLDLTGGRGGDLLVTLHAGMPGLRIVRDSTAGGYAVQVRINGQNNLEAVTVPPGGWSLLATDGATISTIAETGNGGLSAVSLSLLQLLQQVQRAVTDAGLEWDVSDPEKLSQAIGAGGGALDLVRKPTITSPANGDINVGETPTITGTAFLTVYNVAQNSGADGVSVDVATDINFTDIVVTATAAGPATSLAIPGGNLQTDTTYFARLRYQDEETNWSRHSDPVSFSTGATFVSLAQPTVISPTGGATGVSVQPTLSASAFAVDGGGADTFVAAQWEVTEGSGPGASVVHDSGEAAASTSYALPIVLESLTDHQWRVRYKGADLGWGPWSSLGTFTTEAPAGEVTISTAGSGTWEVPAGVTSLRETAIGGGGGGGLFSGGRAAGGTGGSGAQRTRTVVAGQIISFVVGDGGVPGQSGESTSIDAQVTAPGGPAGIPGGAGQPGSIGVGGDINGIGGQGQPDPGFGSMDATTIGAGGSPSAGYAPGSGLLGGGDGNQAPGGGGFGANNGGSGTTSGKAGMVKFEWGPGIVAE